MGGRRRGAAKRARSLSVRGLLLSRRRLTVVRLRRAMVVLRAGRTLQRRSRAASERFTAALIRVRWLRRRVHVGQPTGPVLASALRSRRRTASRSLGSRASPLGTGRALRTSGLVSLRVDISRLRSGGRSTAVARAEQLKTRLDVRVAGIKLGSPLVGIESIRDLVVTRLVLERVSKRRALGITKESLPECRDRTKLRRCRG